MEQIWIAIILGIVEGLTEFVPVSSTGHLISTGYLLNFTGEKAASFEIFIQLGAIIAIVILYRHRFKWLLPVNSLWIDRSNSGFAGLRGCWLLFLTTFPALITGFLSHKLIKIYLFSPVMVAWALGIGGIGILMVEKFRPHWRIKGLDEISGKQALIVGLFQCLALWPGVSRSAATIVGGMLCGFDRKTAAEYSFIAAVPVMFAATFYDLYKTWWLLQASDLILFSLGLIVSLLVALAAVKSFLSLLQRWTLRPFAWYRIVIAPIVYWLGR